RTLWLGAGLSAALPFLVACATAATVPEEEALSLQTRDEDAPTLVVFLIVDQLRGDLLDRYSSLFTGGFKRLLEEGLNFTNALHDHAQTETAPGHATISTGVFPARAGIPSNAWREGEGGDLHSVYNVVDPSVGLVGIPGVPGSSPNVLRRTGLADWVLEAQPGAKVVSISAKDRGAILLAGKSKGEVYWFESRAGEFVTSTYSRSQIPSWLRRFNETGMKKFLVDSVWVSTVPPEVASLSAPDTADFEGDGIHTYFPHQFSQEVTEPEPGDFNFWFEATPMLDRATLDVALLAMEEEKVGQKEGRTDFLSISFSQVDRVGHAYGPLSREQMDNLLRLDGLLGELFEVLDQKVGRENYLVGFTSDHGIMTMPERIEGGGLRLSDEDRSEMEQALSVAARQAGLRPDLSTAGAMVEAMKELSFVGPAFTHDELQKGPLGDPFSILFQHSFTPGRAGGLLSTYGVEMWWKENVLSWGMPVGTTHGSPHRYDRWVPLIVMGPGIEAGKVDALVRPMDLAPTLAGLAGIPYPNDLDGRPLLPRRD
ncbi:MAG: alkaline phosphatase family protein, partial [Longimicrobiales bacterium]|nr:alkaline phosphatase family protein [Longimicrobiales bacterium]